jgi:hypothetical protein
MHSIASTKQGGYFEYKPMYVEQLPIRPINYNNPSEKGIHDRIVSLVEKMLDLHKKKNDLPPSSERDKLEREIAMCDETIDQLVFDLYQLTQEERKSSKRPRERNCNKRGNAATLSNGTRNDS